MRSLVAAPAAVLGALLSFTPAAASQTQWTCGAIPPGEKVAAVGDLDSDGCADFLAGDPGKYPAGETWLVSGRTLAPMKIWAGNNDTQRAVGSALAVGDITGDGKADYAIGAMYSTVYKTNPLAQAGRIMIVDGTSNTIVLTIEGENANEYVGQHVQLFDLDRDSANRLEVFVGVPAYNGGWGQMRAYKVTGTAPNLAANKVRQWTGAAGGDNLGTACAVGDMNKDGIPDVAIGAIGSASSGCRWHGNAYVVVYDGFLQNQLKVLGPYTHGYGCQMDWAGDLNADGHGDFIVGAQMQAYVEVISGNGFTLLTKLATQAPRYARFGFTAKMIADLDKDGTREILVGAPAAICDSPPYPLGWVEVFSPGKSYQRILQLQGPGEGSRFGKDADFGGDVNGDGSPDFLVASDYGGAGDTQANGMVISTKPLSLVADRTTHPLGIGGGVNFYLDAGASAKGLIYVITGSLSGTSPGIPLTPSVHVWLNPDTFMGLQLGFLNMAPFVNFLGYLDANGRATAIWTSYPKIPAPLKWLPMHYAGVVIDFPGRRFVSATNPLPFYLR